MPEIIGATEEVGAIVLTLAASALGFKRATGVVDSFVSWNAATGDVAVLPPVGTNSGGGTRRVMMSAPLTVGGDNGGVQTLRVAGGISALALSLFQDLAGTLGIDLVFDPALGGMVQSYGGMPLRLNHYGNAVLVPTGPLVVAGDPGGAELLRVGGSIRVGGRIVSFPNLNQEGWFVSANVTDGITAAATIARAAPVTQSTWLAFRGGLGVDTYIGREANSDDFVVATWGGIGLPTATLRVSPGGTVRATAVELSDTGSGGGVFIGGLALFSASPAGATRYTAVKTPDGTGGLVLGSGADKSTYSDNDSHSFRSRDASKYFMQLGPPGINLTSFMVLRYVNGAGVDAFDRVKVGPGGSGPGGVGSALYI
jgi:hypothetical protein